MGEIASDGVSNLAFYSRKPAITAPQPQNKLGRPAFDPSKTYVAFVIGDGDSIRLATGESVITCQYSSQCAQYQL